MIDYLDIEIIPNFTLREARCECCDLIILVPFLLVCQHGVRQEYGKPIEVTSWTRCRKHNRAVGGKRDSYHPCGRAIDQRPAGKRDFEFGNNLSRLYEIAVEYYPFVKRYPSFIHCDIRGERV